MTPVHSPPKHSRWGRSCPSRINNDGRTWVIARHRSPASWIGQLALQLHALLGERMRGMEGEKEEEYDNEAERGGRRT